MSNAIYPKALGSFLGGNPVIDFDTDTIKAMLVKTAQGYNLTHQYVSALTAGNIVARSAALTSKTVLSGYADAADVTFTAVPANVACNLIVYKDTGSDATSPLIVFIDTGTGLPITPNGNDLLAIWSGSGIFSLS